MSEEKGKPTKLGTILRNIGMFLTFIGFLLTIMVFFPFLYGISLHINFAFIGMALVVIGMVMTVASAFLKSLKKYQSFSFLKCETEACDYKEIRDFRKGDFVFKEIDRNCKKCGTKLYVSQIAHLPTKDYKTQEVKIKDKKLKPEKEKYITKTVLKCNKSNCAREEIRDFQVGDVIYKELDAQTCHACNSKLYVDNIFHITEEKFNKLKARGKIPA